jgi:TrkA domain protein
MPEVSETQLPGVGVRHEFTTSQGERLTVLTHRTGRRELAVYDRQDPDRCTTMLHLSPDDTRTLAELLGATHVSESLAAAQQRIEGLAIDWITVPEGARVVRGVGGDRRVSGRPRIVWPGAGTRRSTHRPVA